MKKPLPAPTGVDVGDLGADGTCSARVDGREFVVFGALPGERVDIQPRRKNRGRVHGIATAVTRHSADRVEPTCAVASQCGGCSLMHMRIERQHSLKQDWLRAELADVQPEVWLPPLTGPTRAYRAKARLGVRFVEKRGEVLVGFREKLSGFVTDTTRCDVLASPAGELIGPLRTLISALAEPRSVPQIEVTALEGHLVLVFRHLVALSASDLTLLAEFAARHDADIWLQPGGPDTVSPLPGSEPRQLSYTLPGSGLTGSDLTGSDLTGSRLTGSRLTGSDLTMNVAPGDFVQVNTGLNRAMVAQVIELLEPGLSDSVLDLFCGVGNFGLAVARRAGSVLGCDVTPGGIERANANARSNGVSNASFEVRDLMADDLQETWQIAAGKVILDPPRSGAKSVVPLLVRSKVERVVYVSCNPVTLARDVRELVAGGFRLTRAGIMDMFPHTAHVESVAVLER